jgi:hypothetical protein
MARLFAVLAGVAAGAAGAVPALAAQGVTVQVTQVPGEFTAGGESGKVTAVAKRSRGGCGKLRWSLVVLVDGGRPDRVRVDRIEDQGSFPVNVRIAGEAIRITDELLDPGTLCRDRTVTARYAIAFAEDATDADTQVNLVAEAYSAGGRLLDRAAVTRDLRSAGGEGSPEPSADPEGAVPARSGDPTAGSGGGFDANRTSARAGSVRVGPIGLAVGAVMVLLGLSLLVKVRRRSRWIRRVGRAGPTLTLPPLRR